MKNSERLSRKARPGIEPGKFYLPVFSAELLGHWRGQLKIIKSVSDIDFEQKSIKHCFLTLLRREEYRLA